MLVMKILVDIYIKYISYLATKRYASIGLAGNELSFILTTGQNTRFFLTIVFSQNIDTIRIDTALCSLCEAFITFEELRYYEAELSQLVQHFYTRI